MLLNNHIGIFLFFMLRNDQVWCLLNKEEKELIFETNEYHNNYRPDYADPAMYQSGRNFDSTEDRLQSIRGRLLKEHLDRTHPRCVLEIGPGSGFLTRMICEHPSVKTYNAVDINDAFLSWLQPRLERIKKQKPDFTYETFHGDFSTLDLPISDSIILLSSVHHIPNRLELFKTLTQITRHEGHIFAIDGSHYFPRQQDLFIKYIKTYSKKEHWENPRNLGTHHYCTWEEYRKTIRQIPELKVNNCIYYEMSFPIWSRKIISRMFQIVTGKELTKELLINRSNSLLRFFSSQIAVEIQKAPGQS